MDKLQTLEIISVLCNIAFLVLLTQEKKQCWMFGIIGSLLGAYVIYQSGYYSESILYVFYAIVGVYGYVYWDSKKDKEFRIKRSKVIDVIMIILAGGVGTLGLGYLMSKTDASKPYYDALSSVFGVIATFLELYKYFIAWGFWIVINAYTIWLYGIKELNFLAIQMLIYTVLSIYGFAIWYKKLSAKAQ
ncbi:MAG: nicotinamide riboside transporter PnuC [Bacteroidia bacterium]